LRLLRLFAAILNVGCGYAALGLFAAIHDSHPRQFSRKEAQNAQNPTTQDE
jgi:hypothetical protein